MSQNSKFNFEFEDPEICNQIEQVILKYNMKKEITILHTNKWQDYELLDTGKGEKLEKVGPYFFVRPYEDALWDKGLDKKTWESIDGQFFPSKGGAKGGWKMKNKIEASF